MKVGIITFHFVTNQGALLQCYALQKVLENLGHHSEIIDYRPYYHVFRYAVKKNPFAYAKWYYSKYPKWRRIKRIRLYLSTFVKCCKSNVTKRELPARKHIDLFISNYLRLSRPYKSLDDLRNDPPKLDAYVSGSDQIWNPDILDHQYDPAYFLSFGDENVRRLTYAASVGRSPNEMEQRQIHNLCKRIDYVSLRENDRETIEAVGKPVCVCLDPTLLLDKEDYQSIENRACLNEEPFIFVYGFETNEDIKNAVGYAASKYNCKIINGSPSRIKLDCDCKLVDCYGPDGFLGYIDKATCVVTNSFHGTALSIVYQKEFICVPHMTRGARMRELLDKLGLNDRLWNSSSDNHGLSDSIDYSQVRIRLNMLRDDSIHYLENAMT